MKILRGSEFPLVLKRKHRSGCIHSFPDKETLYPYLTRNHDQEAARSISDIIIHMADILVILR